MATTLEISDGTTTVTLLNTTGFDVMKWTPGSPELRRTMVSSPLSDGDFLRRISRGNVTEDLECMLTGTSDNNIASQLQTLYDLLENAHKYHTTEWQTTPVYIRAQTQDETGARYALLFYGEVIPGESWMDPEFADGHVWRGLSIKLEREPFWRDTAPGELPTSAVKFGVFDGDGNFEESIGSDEDMFVPNSFDDVNIDVVRRANWISAGSTDFSGNFQAGSNFNYFPSPSGVNDYFVLGSTEGPFRNAVFFISENRNDGNGNADADLVWEFSTGTGWESIASYIDDGTQTFRSHNQTTRHKVLKFVAPTPTWATCTIVGDAVYAIRCRIASIGTTGAVPGQASRTVFAVRDPRIRFSASNINDGDVPALLRLTLNNKGIGANNLQRAHGIYGFIAGGKSRGDRTFNARVNFGGNNSASWTMAPRNNSDIQEDTSAPGNRNLMVGFGTNNNMVRRWSGTNSSATVRDWIGTYRVFGRFNQTWSGVGSSQNDITVQLVISVNDVSPSAAGARWLSETKRLTSDSVPLTTVIDQGQVIDFGTVTIPPVSQARGLRTRNASLIDEVSIDLNASREGSGASLVCYDLIFMPIDELVIAAECRDFTATSGMGLIDRSTLVVDGGLIGTGAQWTESWQDSGSQTTTDWFMTSPPPTLPSDRNIDLHFLFFRGNLPVGSNFGQGVNLTLHKHSRWYQLRGAD